MNLVSCSTNPKYEADYSLIDEKTYYTALYLNGNIQVSFFTQSKFHTGEFRKLGSNHNSKLILNDDFFIAVSYGDLEKGIKNSIKRFIVNPYLSVIP